MASGLAAKLNWKPGVRVAVVAPPPGFDPAAVWSAGDLGDDGGEVAFALVFCATPAEVAAAAADLAPRSPGDPTLWFAYRKGRRTATALSRDRGWEPLGEAGFEPVRQVSIDDEWSALRFRRVERIARLTRDPSWRLTEEGRRRSDA